MDAVERIVEVPLDAISEDTTYRFRLWIDVRELVEDIRVNGQDFPIVVRPMGEGYQLVCGFRRVTALRALGRETARAVVRELDDEAALRIAWAENEARASYSDVDRAHAVLKATRAGFGLRRLEELFGLRKSQLGSLRKLALMPEVVQEAVEAGRITTTHAVTLNALRVRYPDLEYERWIGEIVEHGLSLRQLKQRVGLAYDRPRVPVAEVDAGRGLLWLRTRRLVVAKLGAEERGRLIEELEAALEMLRGKE